MQLTVVDHPLAATRLTTMRDEATPSPLFRAALHELSTLLVYEATRDFAVEGFPVTTPVAPTTGTRLAVRPLLVPVLRAGLGMLAAAQGLLPEASTGFLGLSRDEETHQPTVYMQNLPADLAGFAVLVLDPMLATGGSLAQVCALLAARGAHDLVVVTALAAPVGIEAVRETGLVRHLVTATVEERLNDQAFIVPGLGDAGDRQFNP